MSQTCRACGNALVRSSVAYDFGYCSRSCWNWHSSYGKRMDRDDYYETRRQVPMVLSDDPLPPTPICVACGDTGKNSHGGECVPCRLNGRLGASRSTTGQLQLF